MDGLFIQALLSGVTSGFVYALIGVGLAIIFKGARIVNVMQGEFSVIGAMVTVALMQQLALPYAVSIAVGVVLGMVLGVLIELVFVRPMIRRNAPEDSYLLLTIGLAIALSASVLYFGGRNSHLLPSFGEDRVFVIYEATIREHALWLIVIALAGVGLLQWMYKKTILGLSMIAASNDPDGALSTGINVARMRTLTFALGGGFGALAGILVTPLTSVNYHMGLAFTLKGFAAAILGGLMNPVGAVVGGVTMGLFESLSIVYFPSGYKDVIAMTVLIAIMIFLPNGMLGKSGRKGG